MMVFMMVVFIAGSRKEEIKKDHTSYFLGEIKALGFGISLPVRVFLSIFV